MRQSATPSWFRRLQRPRLPLRRVLLAGLLFELCVGMGVVAAPLLSGWTPRLPVRVADPVAERIAWRQARTCPADEPRLGALAPALTLYTPQGQPFRRVDLGGKRAVLLFASGESG